MEIIQGTGSPGMAEGTALVLSDIKNYGDALKMGFTEARDAVVNELRFVRDLKGIFAAHIEIAQDPMLADSVMGRISRGMQPIRAVREAEAELLAVFDSIEDEYLRSRADDVRDVIENILAKMTGREAKHMDSLVPGTIIVASEILPSDTAAMDLRNVAAFVTEKGSITSHVCIIAGCNGIPAVIGAGGCTKKIRNGDKLLVDCKTDGRCRVVSNPTSDAREEFERAMKDWKVNSFKAQESAFEPAMTKSGIKCNVYANAGNLADIATAIDAGAEGIGLLRSEFLYLNSTTFPSEETQFEAYRDAACICGDKPLVIRTLDIGGDKYVPYMQMPREDNPFLGLRAIRFCLRNPDLFKIQLRAILRASGFGNIRILLPMVVKADEVRQVRALLLGCAEELGITSLPKLGVMIETPSAVFMADELAEESDFFSIGTNDLTQYIMAADRCNADVAYLYDALNPAVLRAIRHIIKVVDGRIPVEVCGEIASVPETAKVLLSEGVTAFSVRTSSVPLLKVAIRNCE